MDYDKPMTEYQRELLTVLCEESCEIGHITCKALRHGLLSHHPNGGPLNVELIHREIGDLLAVIDLLESEQIISRRTLDGYRKRKHIEVNKYLHYKSQQS